MFKSIIEQELINNNITLHSWSRSSCGWADIKNREIKIPKPLDYDRLGVCFHEIGHVVLNHSSGKPRYIEEYEAEKFAIEKLKQYNAYNKKYELRAIAYVLSKIAQAKNRRLNVDNIPAEIIAWTGLQKRKWKKANKVWVSRGTVNKRSEIKVNFY